MDYVKVRSSLEIVGIDRPRSERRHIKKVSLLFLAFPPPLWVAQPTGGSRYSIYVANNFASSPITVTLVTLRASSSSFLSQGS